MTTRLYSPPNAARRLLGLISGSLLLAATVSCGSPADKQAEVTANTTNQAPDEQAPDEQAGTVADAHLVVAQATTANQPIAIVPGDYSWKRLLGSDFDGLANSPGIQFDWSRKPTVAWRLEVGDGYGLGCVDNGRYYHADATVADGVRVERLRAFNLDDASLAWSVQRPMQYQDMYGYESGPRGTPTIAGDSIITFGCDGELICRNTADGSQLWSVATNKQYGVVQNFFGVGSSPLILDSAVVVPVGGSPLEDQQIAPGRLDRVISNGSALVAFDLKTGDEIWRCGKDLASYSSPRTMTIDGQTVVLLFARDQLLAVDPEQGNVLWSYPHRASILESVNAMMPVVDGDHVFISECYQVGSVMLRVTPESATPVWKDPPQNRRAQSMRCHWSTPILIDGFLYGCSGRNNPDSDFRCVEFETGKVQWSDGRRVRTSLARAGDHLVVLDEYGFLQVVRPSPEKLDVVVEHDFSDLVSSPCWAAPIIVGNRILIRGNHHVLCLLVPTK